MADLRDWVRTLQPASYKGVPFFWDESSEEGGRNPVIHTFPNRDDPYLEDLGEEPRTFSAIVYVHGNAADAAANALMNALASPGPGPLILPVRGAVMVRAQPFKRREEKDRLGYIAFECKFIRDGAPGAIVSLPALLNIAFGAVDVLHGAAVAAFSRMVRLIGVPDVVAAAAYSGLASGAAAIDLARTTNAVEPAVSAAVRDDLAAVVAGADAADDAGLLADNLFAATRSLSDGMAPEVAVSAMANIVETFAPAASAAFYTDTVRMEAENAEAAFRLVRLAALSALTDAVLRQTYPARPEGVAARARIAAYFAAEMNAAQGADLADLYIALAAARGRTIDYLSREIADLAPVVTVTANAIMPSLFWAWQLYADPARAGELTGRNAVRHPSIMPTTFSALAR